jgi:hypothetical protein
MTDNKNNKTSTRGVFIYGCLIVTFLSIAIQSNGQEIYVCHTTTEGSKAMKCEMKIIVTDSLVKFEFASKPATSYKKLPSSFGIYYTDGVTKSYVSAVPATGEIRGLPYNYVVKLVSNLGTASNGSIESLPSYFCVLKN